MKATKVFTVLLGVAQLILFIKLVELVEGASAAAASDHGGSEAVSNASSVSFENLGNNERREFARAASAFRSFFLAPRSVSQDSSSNRTTEIQTKDGSFGRACPACSGDECNGSVTSYKYTVPIIPLKIAAAVGLLWLIFYFKVWKFPKHPPSTEHNSGYPAAVVGNGGYSSGGYPAGGYSNSGGYGGYPSMDTGYSGGDGAGGVLDSVMRAIEKFSQ